ncbi:MAG TPA: sugar ABC transporter ATP-binding protein [Roseiarcus sp.]|nr:sugar ABC transporter ATP-binding protein [Roseiarcus sp.]
MAIALSHAEGGGRGGASAPPVLRIEGLSKSFGGAQALDNVSLTVRHGEVHGLLGQNGSGKSTLIKILSGFHSPDGSPKIEIDGRSVSLPVSLAALRANGVSFVHQHLGLLPSLTVLENLLLSDFAAENRWYVDWRAEARRARRLFERYDIRLEPTSPLADLTPVERAQLAIVRAFDEVTRDKGQALTRGLLVLDEPTPFLPAQDVDALFKLIRGIVADGASVIFVSHDIDEVLEITDRATVLRDGRVAGVFETAATSKAEVIRLIVGEHVDLEALRPAAKELAAPSIVISGLSGGSLGPFSVSLAPGEVVGLTGLIGSGYDEVVYMTYGAAAAAAGAIEIDGVRSEIASLTPRLSIARGCVLIPGDRLAAGAVASLSVKENLNQPVMESVSRAWALSDAKLARNAAALVGRFDVRPRDPAILFASLSGGNQQKVLLAKWFQTRPRLILLDEPTQGVDIGARAQVFAAIAEAARQGAAVLCASSDYEQLTAICDRVLIFNRGRVAQELVGAQISKPAIAEACYKIE